MPPRLARLLHDSRGTALIEFAVVGPFALLLLIGVLETGRMFWTSHSLQYAVDQAGRHAMIHRVSSESVLADLIRNQLGGIADGTLQIDVTQTVDSGRTYVRIRASKPFSFAGGLFGTFDVDVGGNTSVPLLPAS